MMAELAHRVGGPRCVGLAFRRWGLLLLAKIVRELAHGHSNPLTWGNAKFSDFML